MKILVLKNDWLISKHPIFKDHLHLFQFGWGNGYALIPRGHKLYGKDYDQIPVQAHGGLTFGRFLGGKAIKHYGLSKRHLGKWMVGFDTCHFGDTPENCPKEYVIQEARELAQQLEILNKHL